MNEETKVSSSSVEDAKNALKKAFKVAGEKLKAAGIRIKNFEASSPQNRARAAGRYLARLASIWGVLSIIGAVIMMFFRTCVDQGDYGTCWEYERPYITWAIVSLLGNLIVASFMYSVGTYIEAKMSDSDSGSGTSVNS